MLEQLKRAAEYIAEVDGRRRGEAARVRGAAPRTQEMLEPLIVPLEHSEVEGKVSAVDGGILNHEMHGADLVVGKAVSSTFEYGGGRLKAHSYCPNAFPQPSYEVKIGLDEREVNWHKALFRLNLEITNAVETARAHRPDFLFLDGSVVPLACDRPSEDSALFEDYLLLINRYKELFKFCGEAGICLAGIVKDSRGKRMMEVLGKHTGERCADSVFLNHMLKEGERTGAVHYSSNPKQNAVMKDLGEWGERVKVSYLKPVAADRPLRVEFLEGKDYGRVCGVIASLSRINRNYAYPAVLIDADLRAAMDPLELERAIRSLSMFAGPELMQLRRNSRPFR